MTKPSLILLATLALIPSSRVSAAGDFFAEVERRAAELAAKPYEAQERNVPDEARTMDYSVYQDIRFNPQKALWASLKEPFRLQMFFRAFIFPERVDINVLDPEGKASRVEYQPSMFSMVEGSGGKLPTVPENYGFSGLKIFHDFGKTRGWEEAIIFQGASYFRIPAKGQVYGLSARGLAINTAFKGAGEEFPAFKEFWAAEPKAGATEVTVYALLDGPSVSGAYQFVVKPEKDTTSVDVKASLIFRGSPGRVGYAPLTSMFWYGENNYRKFSDYRSEVHDSDGLLILEQDGSRLWRPLQTVTHDLVDFFTSGETPKGFGLLLRDRDFGHYEDIEANYHGRPSLWVEPKGDWEKGSVVLWQIPTVDEYHDNIVAYWMPEKTPKAGEKHTLSYRLLATTEEPPALPESGQVKGTYIMTSYGKKDRFYIMVDYAWGAKTPDLAKPPVMELRAEGAEILSQYVKPNKDGRCWRAHMVVQFPSEQMSNVLTCKLVGPGTWTSELWSYTFVPQE